jgi:hypothetical protein
MGTVQLNNSLQQLFNPAAPDKRELEGRWGTKQWREGDRVTHLKNDTTLDVYNGDQGYIERIDPDAAQLTVRYPPRAKRAGNGSTTAGSSELTSDSDSDSDVSDDLGAHRVTYRGHADITDMLQLAWATTVHKVGGQQAMLTQGCMQSWTPEGVSCVREHGLVVAAVHTCLWLVQQRPSVGVCRSTTDGCCSSNHCMSPQRHTVHSDRLAAMVCWGHCNTSWHCRVQFGSQGI